MKFNKAKGRVAARQACEAIEFLMQQFDAVDEKDGPARTDSEQLFWEYLIDGYSLVDVKEYLDTITRL